MSREKTTNLKMNKWEPDEGLIREEWNENFKIIDEATEGNTKRLTDISTNINGFGAEGNRITDDTLAIQNAYNTLNPGDTLLIPKGEFLVTNLVFDRDDVFIDWRGTLIQKTSATGACVQIGSRTKPLFRLVVVGMVRVTSQTIDWNKESTGLQLMNCNEITMNVDIQGFRTNLEFVGDDNGCCYNNIHISRIYNHKYGVLFTELGTGWTNENKFFGGRFTWASNLTKSLEGESMEQSVARLGIYHVYIPNTSMNANRFYSPSFEGSNGTFFYCNGQYNSFDRPRFEGSSIKCHFGKQSLYNDLFRPYAHTKISEDPTYKNEGSRNLIVGRNEILADFTTYKAALYEASGNPSSFGKEALFSGMTTNTSFDKVFQGKNSAGIEKFSVNGDGKILGLSLQLTSGLLLDNEGRLSGGQWNLVSDSYVGSPVKIAAVKGTAGAPTTNGIPIGCAVLNTVDNKLYFHMGSGIWKGTVLS